MSAPLRLPRFFRFIALVLTGALCIVLVATAPVSGQTPTPTPSTIPTAAGAAALQEAQRLADAGKTEAALAALRQAVEFYRSVGNADGEVAARFYLALYLRGLDRCVDAIGEYEAALESARRLGNAAFAGSLWLGIGDCQSLLGELPDALSAYEAATRLFLESEDAAAPRSAVSAYNSAGNTLHALGRYEEARARFQAGLLLALALEDQRAEMMLQGGLGNAYTALGQHEQALAAFIRCRDLAQAVADPLWEQMALQGAGGARSSLHQYEAAYADFEAGVALARERADIAGEAMLRMDAGLALHDLGRYSEALHALEQALALERAAGNQPREALALTQIGAALEGLGRNGDALARYEAARDIAVEVQDERLLARIENDLGLLYDLLGRGADARAMLDSALRRARRLGDQRLGATARNNQGTLANHWGQYAEAEAAYSEALATSRKLGAARDEAITLNNLALNYDSQGRYDEARPLYEQALAIHRRLGDPVGSATVVENLAGQDAARGRYAEALEGYRSALAVFEEQGLAHQQATGLSNLATLYSTLGRFDDARKSYAAGLSLRRRIGDRAGEGVILGNLAALDYELGEYESALAGYRDAQVIAAEAGDASAAATWQNHVAAVLSEMGRGQEAYETYQAALEQFRQLGDQAGEAAALNGLGVTQALPVSETAVQYLDQALALYLDLADVAGRATALSNKAFVLEQLGRNEEALEAYRKSLALREQLRGQTPGEDLRLGITQDAGAVYDAAATLAMKLGRGEEAFSLTERARGRQLLDRLGAGRVDPATGADGALLEREQMLRAEISRLDQGARTERIKPSGQRNAERLQTLSQALSARQAEYDSLLADIKSRNPQYAAMVSPEPASLAQIQALLPPDMTLVDYYIGIESSFAFVIQADNFQPVALRAPAAEVWEQVAAFRSSFSDLANSSPAAATWLSERLISPVAPFLSTHVVGFVPHGPLHYLPFAALVWTGPETAANRTAEPSAVLALIDRFVMFTLPSISVLPYLPLELPTGREKAALVLAYANPAGLSPLEQADVEAQAVAEALGAQPLLGAAASETALRKQASGHDVIHIAAHGQLNRNAPLFSRLHLAPDAANDGSFEVHEVYSLDLKGTDLVTLSACQTDLGKLNVGDDVTGLSRSFLYAGARSVVASLWSVDDAATAALMAAFYKNLAAGMGKAQALTVAQTSVRDDPSHPEWRHPYYWAAFVLSGDPGVTVARPRGGVLSAPWTRWAAAGIAGLLVLLAAVGILLRRPRRRVL